jgi:mRNA-degrading endonuclease toxin of MazEF toxin-antitoxin module
MTVHQLSSHFNSTVRRVNPWSSFEALRLDQIRTVDRRRLVRHLGVVDSPIMAKVGEALKISLGLVYL